MRLREISKNVLFVPVVAGALLCSCITSTNEDNDEKNTNEVEPESSFTYDVNGNVSFSDATLNEDKSFDDAEFKNKITITFNGTNKPTIEPTATDGVEITTSEKGSAHLIIKSEKKINYILKGSSNNGSLMIFSQKKFKLTLDSLTLSNDAGLPAISSQTKKRCFVETIGTADITDAESYSLGDAYKKDEGQYDAKGAIFSEGELIFVGNGTLNVTGRCRHAICSDQYVRISSGTVNVKGAKKDGIHANDAVLVYGGTVNISGITQADENDSIKKLNGIECEKGYIVIKGGKIDITSPGIGIYASKDDFKKGDAMTEKSFVYIDGGEIAITTNGEKGHGISSESHLIIKGDATKIKITAKGNSAKGLKTGANVFNDDDSEKGQIVFAGGTVNIFSKDAVLDPEDDLYIWGGTLNAVGGACVAREKIKGSQPCAIASFSGIIADEKIKFSDTEIDLTIAEPLPTAKVLLSNGNLTAGATPDVSIGSQTVKAEVK